MLFRGGPVGPDGALAIAELRSLDDQPVGFRPVDGRLGLVDLDTPVELLAGTLAGLRIFAGYAGWGAGQLEGEIEEGSWYVVPALARGRLPPRPRRALARRAAAPARRARLALHPAGRSRAQLSRVVLPGLAGTVRSRPVPDLEWSP